MSETFTYNEIEEIAAVVRTKITHAPKVGLILGSGLGSLAAAVDHPANIPYNSLPAFPVSTVEGHVGQFVFGSLETQPVVVMQGRLHYYEGYSMAEVTLPIRVMQLLGVEYFNCYQCRG